MFDNKTYEELKSEISELSKQLQRSEEHRDAQYMDIMALLRRLTVYAEQDTSDSEQIDGEESVDEKYDEVHEFVVEQGKASTAMLQRQFSIGYGRAARLIDQLEDRGIITPSDGSNRPRLCHRVRANTSAGQSRITPRVAKDVASLESILSSIVSHDSNDSMKIYLDIDGTLIHEDIERAGEPAEGLEDFIRALRPYDVYWLTTHCMDGDPIHARKLMKASVPAELHADIDRIKPTRWGVMKTEAIDFSGPFIWFDNDVMASERQVLRNKAVNERQWLIEVNFEENPRRLVEIVREVLRDLQSQ